MSTKKIVHASFATIFFVLQKKINYNYLNYSSINKKIAGNIFQRSLTSLTS